MSLPDLIELVPLKSPVRAEITVPGSKSITNRALILAALSTGKVSLKGALWSEDTQIMTECLQQLGFRVDVRPDPDEVCNRSITVDGQGGRVPAGGTDARPLELFVGNAGTAARFLAAFLCLGRGVYRLSGVPRMHERPQEALLQALGELGYRVESENGNNKLPVKISGGGRPIDQDQTGKVETGNQALPFAPGLLSTAAATSKHCTVSIEKSSQFASALLLCSKTGGWQVGISGENAEESPYVAMTSRMMESFPWRGGNFHVEPDSSSGSYFVAAGELFPSLGYPAVSIADWPASAWQVDSNFVRALPLPPVLSRGGRTEPGIIQLGDSIMTAIAVAAFSAGPCRFENLGRLRLQECERVAALRTELTKCGGNVLEEGDTLLVSPSNLHGAEIETYNDHRMAMCFAILGLKVTGIKIKNPACVKKTFPNFFQKLAAPQPRGLGALILDGRTGRTLASEELFAD